MSGGPSSGGLAEWENPAQRDETTDWGQIKNLDVNMMFSVKENNV